jgi:molybdate transport system permease protein
MADAPLRSPRVLWPLAVLGFALVAIPVVGLLWRIEWSSLPSELTRSGVLGALRLSLVCSVSAAMLSMLLGFPAAWVLARTRLPGRSLWRAIVLLPLVLPPVVGGVALLGAFSRRGMLGGWLFDATGVQLTFSTTGAIVAQTFVALPFFVLTVEGGLRQLGTTDDEAAATLGASPWYRLRHVTLPLLRPSLIAGAVLAWARALGEFGATLTFAGNVAGRTRTLPLAVYLELDGRPQAAYAMSFVLLVVSVAVLVGMRSRWLGQL